MPSKRSGRRRAVREPIQVYLTEDERALLDRLATEHEVSRAEILRRGIRSFAAQAAGGSSPLLDYLVALGGDDWPADVAERHDDHLAETYRNRHDRP